MSMLDHLCAEILKMSGILSDLSLFPRWNQNFEFQLLKSSGILSILDSFLSVLLILIFMWIQKFAFTLSS